MSEMKEENKTVYGQIQIADEVIAIIAATAAQEVEGVSAASTDPTGSFVEFFGKKNQSKGVRVAVESGETSVEVDIAIHFGVKIQETATEVQRKVKNAIETMTGLSVVTVNVNVTGIIIDKAPVKDAVLTD